MARMIGKTLRFRQCPYECCGVQRDKHEVKRRERVEWQREAEQEMEDDG